MDTRYKQRREEFDQRFERAALVKGSEQSHVSPSGRFSLTTMQYSSGPSTWSFSRGVVTDLQTGAQVADVRRNFGHFWHAFVAHPNGHEYLLCGEDYQGYSILNLTLQQAHVHFPEAGYKGVGVCWAEVFPSPDGLVLAVAGCIWGGPYDLILLDFRKPDAVPLPELCREESIGETSGWKDNDTFVLTREIECRKSDGKPYASLSSEEQDAMDASADLWDYKIEALEVKRPPFAERNSKLGESNGADGGS